MGHTIKGQEVFVILRLIRGMLNGISNKDKRCDRIKA